uniref:Large ribosomal subunit protein uL23c n=1 Tax=Astrosyne radiata TaxID=1158023 RepID=A0A2U9NT84_9STRA|nr:ribosomal protein L23 [Astrosyne radiata]AWT40350.1 ribosomal protein L23 [Astrosyne radiata]
MNNIFKLYSNFNRIIKYPIITEKYTELLEKNKYNFVVNRTSHKKEILISMESLFPIKIQKVNSYNFPKKKTRFEKYRNWKVKTKRSILTLSSGDIINLFTEN